MDPLHATIEQFAAEGYTHVECFCPRCRVIRLGPMSWLPKNLDGAHCAINSQSDFAALSAAVRCNRSNRGGTKIRLAGGGGTGDKRSAGEVTLIPRIIHQLWINPNLGIRRNYARSRTAIHKMALAMPHVLVPAVVSGRGIGNS